MVFPVIQDMVDGGDGGVTKMTVRSAQVLMTPVHVPFTFSLSPESCLYSNKVHSVSVSTSSTCDYSIGYYWALPISTFYKLLRSPWSNFYQAFHNPGQGPAECQSSSVSLSPPHTSRDSVLRSQVGMELGQAPREVYPLVVVMVRTGSQAAAQPGQVTVLVNIIHLKDETCLIPSQVLSVYIRQGPALTLLRQMFLSDGENSDTESAEESDTEDSPGVGGGVRARCVVCQVERVNRVALPCRHAASCPQCFDRLEARCPMCRALITSYFKLRPDPDPVTEEVQPQPEDRAGLEPGWRSWWRRYNHWVNNVAGLIEN